MTSTPTATRRSMVPEPELHTTTESPITFRTAIEPPKGRHLSLADFYDEEAPTRNPALTRVLMEFLERNNVERAFAPRLRFTRAVARPYNMDICIKLPNGIPLFRSTEPADAVTLTQPGDAFIGSFAGCAALAMVCGDMLVAGHGGRDSFIDRNAVNGAPSHMDKRSIVDTMAIVVCGGNRELLSRASCRSFYSLARLGHRYFFNHPEHGTYNEAFRDHLEERYDAVRSGIMVPIDNGFELDQGALIGAQARKYGFHRVSTCISPLRTNGEYASTYHSSELLRTKRNLVAIVRQR